MKKNAFTLIELLVSISIIAVLTAVLLPNFMGAREKAKDAQKKHDLYAMKNALRLYYNDYQTYPTTLSAGTTVWVNNYDGSNIGSTLGAFMPGVLTIGYTYEYTSNLTGDGFFLRVRTEANSPDNGDSQSKCGIGVTDSTYYYVCTN